MAFPFARRLLREVDAFLMQIRSAISRNEHALHDLPWFLIAGPQRCGTTLMRLVLECHSQVQCCDERWSYSVISGRFCPEIQKDVLGLKVPCITEQLLNASLRDPIMLREVPNRYKGQPVIYMVRDVRGAVASMWNLRKGRRRWLDTYMEPVLRDKLVNDIRFNARFYELIARADKACNPQLARAAIYWRYKIEPFFEYEAKGLPVLPVRYEDLVKDPETECRRICNFLRIDLEPSMLAHSSVVHPDLYANGLAIGNTDPKRPIDDASIDLWKQLLTANESAEIADLGGFAQNAFYGSA
jgi:hypothetical protein